MKGLFKTCSFWKYGSIKWTAESILSNLKIGKIDNVKSLVGGVVVVAGVVAEVGFSFPKYFTVNCELLFPEINCLNVDCSASNVSSFKLLNSYV